MSSKQYVKSHAVSLGLVLVFLAASALVAFYSMKNQPPREISFELEHLGFNNPDNPDGTTTLTDKTWTKLRLTGVKFDAAGRRMTGELELSLTPNELKDAESKSVRIGLEERKIVNLTQGILKNLEPRLVYFSHYEPSQVEKMGRSNNIGGSEKPIQTSASNKDAYVMKGKAPFTWTAESQVESFWYPFDSYRLYVNPGITLPYDGDKDDGEFHMSKESLDSFEYFADEVDKVSLEFADTNLVAELTAKQYDDLNLKVFGDPFEINLYRPFLARAYTVFVIVLMAFGLVYLYFFKDIEGSAGDLLGFFVAALGTRAILLAGVDFSPVLLDYVVVFFAILATGVVFGRWIDKRLQPDNSVACPHCTGRISPAATRCPHCTGML